MSSMITIRHAGELKKNDHVMVRGHPCRIASAVSRSPGKHGHAKVRFIAYDIFTAKRFEEVHPSHRALQCPEVKRDDYVLVSLASDGDDASIMNDDGELVEFVKISTSTAESLTKAYQTDPDLEVTVLSAPVQGHDGIFVVNQEIVSFKKCTA